MQSRNYITFISKLLIPPFINKIMGSSIYFLAGNVFNWKIQHNLLHHTYTNILGHDEDLEAGRVLRFSKNAEWMPHHRFQHLYFFFLFLF